MRTTAMLVGLALVLGSTVAVAAEPPGDVPAADEGMGAGGDHPAAQGPGRPGGWPRGFGQSDRHPRPLVIGLLLRHRQDLGLTTQQVDSLRKLGLDFWRAAIQRGADWRIARLDLMSLRWSEPVDMGKVEAKVREIEKLKGDGLIAAFRTAEAAKAQLTAEQRDKLKGLWATRMQRRGAGEGGAMDAPDSDRMQ